MVTKFAIVGASDMGASGLTYFSRVYVAWVKM